MCGIAGIVSLTDDGRVDPDRLAAMAGALLHRGPDNQGLYLTNDRREGLAFRRLSIIDLQTGNQPIANEDQTIRVVCNGEIYNFKALRQQLSANHAFRTAGDIEPIVHLYEQFGLEFLSRLDGFFALALLDSQRSQLLLAVDRFGKKPLYYAEHEGCLYFGSEPKAIRKGGVDGEFSRPALIDYLRFGWIPAPATIFSNVRKLEPGHCLRISLIRARRSSIPALVPVRYYRSAVAAFSGTYDQARHRVRSVLSGAVAKRLVADVPVGVLLSGGVDSAVVTALAAQASSDPVRTFTVGFDHDRYDERRLARLTAQRYKTDHHEIVLKPDLDGLLEQVVETFDEPFADSSAVPTRLICRFAAEQVKVVLTGDGGDEAFAGYDRYRALAIASSIHRLGLGPSAAPLARLMASAGPELRSSRTRLWRLIRALPISPAEQYASFLRLFDDRTLIDLLGSDFTYPLTDRPDWIAQAVDARTDVPSAVRRANLADYQVYLPHDLLVKIDRTSMAAGLEARSPLLDRELVEFALSLPLAWRTRLKAGKRILRDTFAADLPPEVLAGPKRGFGVPVGDWLHGPLRSQMEHRLSPDSRLIRSGIFRFESLTRLMQEHLACRHDHGHRLWALMVLDQFLTIL
ncbi:MAG: asparagine synthase (glutamine-hydrolyzing) [Phycisphaerae bacterium]|nr:asparagine synthase (glutamine-hydrolyzing) [Phycisphaerae bacterium]